MKIPLAITTVLLCISCATTSALDKAMNSGAEVVEGGQLALIGDAGMTALDTGGEWSTYYSTDGRKVVKIDSSGEVKELTWRVNESGQFCQQLFATEKEECNTGSTYLLRTSEGVHSIIMDGKLLEFRFTVAEGNVMNL